MSKVKRSSVAEQTRQLAESIRVMAAKKVLLDAVTEIKAKEVGDTVNRYDVQPVFDREYERLAGLSDREVIEYYLAESLYLG